MEGGTGTVIDLATAGFDFAYITIIFSYVFSSFQTLTFLSFVCLIC